MATQWDLLHWWHGKWVTTHEGGMLMSFLFGKPIRGAGYTLWNYLIMTRPVMVLGLSVIMKVRRSPYPGFVGLEL